MNANLAYKIVHPLQFHPGFDSLALYRFRYAYSCVSEHRVPGVEDAGKVSTEVGHSLWVHGRTPEFPKETKSVFSFAPPAPILLTSSFGKILFSPHFKLKCLSLKTKTLAGK